MVSIEMTDWKACFCGVLFDSNAKFFIHLERGTRIWSHAVFFARTEKDAVNPRQKQNNSGSTQQVEQYQCEKKELNK